MIVRAIAALAVAATFSTCANAGPAKGTVECEGARHALGTAVAIWVPSKSRFAMLFFAGKLSEEDQALAARLRGESILGRIPKGFKMQTSAEAGKSRELDTQQVVLLRGDIKAAADKFAIENLDGAFLVSVNCGPNKSFNLSMRATDKDAGSDMKKQFPGFVVPLKAGALVKISSAKYVRKPDPKSKSGSQMSAAWQFQGEAKLHVFE